MKAPGTKARLYYDCGLHREPVVGDMVATPAGSCYLIDGVRRSRRRPERVYLDVTRLERDACEIGDEGVWPLFWYERKRAIR